MKKTLLALLCAVGLSQATVINWSDVNDLGQLSDWTATDGYYTGTIGAVKYNDGTISNSDALHGLYSIIDLSADKFYLSTSNVPSTFGTVLFSADFGFDVTAANVESIAPYTLSNVTINNTIGSAALAEFAIAIANYPDDANYKFSMIDGLGNGQVSSVPEPTTLGLMGLGFLGLAAGIRRRKK